MTDSRIYEKKAFEEFKNKSKPEIVTKYLLMNALYVIVDKIKKVNLLIAMIGYKEFQINHHHYNLEPEMIELFDIVASGNNKFDKEKVETLTLALKFIIPDDYYDLLIDKFKLSKNVAAIFLPTKDVLTFKHLL